MVWSLNVGPVLVAGPWFARGTVRRRAATLHFTASFRLDRGDSILAAEVPSRKRGLSAIGLATADARQGGVCRIRNGVVLGSVFNPLKYSKPVILSERSEESSWILASEGSA